MESMYAGTFPSGMDLPHNMLSASWKNISLKKQRREAISESQAAVFHLLIRKKRRKRAPPPPESLLQDGGFVALLGGSELPSLQGFRQRQEALLAGALLRWGHVHWREENSGIVKARTALRVYGCMKRTDGKWDGMEWK